MEPTIVYSVQAGPSWDWKVALDLFFGGAGVGAFLFSVALFELWGRRYRRVPQTAAILAPALVILGVFFLLIKLGRPHDLWLTFINFAPTSPLWWGGIFQTLFVIGAVCYALQWRNAGPNLARRWLGRALVPIALIVGGYHGLLLAVITARPLWNTGPTVMAALLGFASTGIAAVMLVHLGRMWIAGRLADSEHVVHFLDDIRPVRSVLAATLFVQLGVFFFWWLSLFFGSLDERLALEAANLAWGPMFWWIGIGLGLVLPLVLGAWLVWRGESAHRRAQVAVVVLTSCLILVGGLVFRLAVVLGGQAQVPSMTLS
jgi:protein NrfD